MLKNNFKITKFASIVGLLHLVLFHYPFFKYVVNNIDSTSFGGILLIASLVILVPLLNAWIFLLLINSSRRIAKIVLILFFIINAISVYFINTYGIIIDESMIGNVLNTNYSESSSFFSLKLVGYILFLCLVPSVFIAKAEIIKLPIKNILKLSLFALLAIAILVGINAKNLLWIDNNSKQIGGLAMPWSYVVNTSLFYKHKSNANEKEILLPNATIKDNQKTVVVLVIGESARRANFSLYGYSKNTNPLLSKKRNLFHFNATSCATYTTAGVKCILEHTNTDELYEILPNYLERNNVEVVWRTTNWGEPPLHIKNYQKREFLLKNYAEQNGSFDEILISDLKKQIMSSTKNKILIVLHTATSHGPKYSTRYPRSFEKFSPVCNSVEPGKCSQQELVNAYDNTIVYTDYLLSSIINRLQELPEFKSTMMFVSDHGESLGEKNLYMHGLPMSFAPKEQYEIPFIVWTSNNSVKTKPTEILSQNHVFHSVLNFLAIDSPIYNESLNIFKK